MHAQTMLIADADADAGVGVGVGPCNADAPPDVLSGGKRKYGQTDSNDAAHAVSPGLPT